MRKFPCAVGSVEACHIGMCPEFFLDSQPLLND